MKRNFVVAAVLSGIVLMSGEVLAQRGRHHRGHRMMAHRFEALDLTSDQKAKLKSLRADGHKAMAQLEADVKVARIELGEAIRQTTIEQADINKAVDKLNRAQSSMTSTRVNSFVKMKSVLTIEQREKMGEMGPPEHGMRRREMHRRGMRHGMRGEFGTERGHDCDRS